MEHSIECQERGYASDCAACALAPSARGFHQTARFDARGVALTTLLGERGYVLRGRIAYARHNCTRERDVYLYDRADRTARIPDHGRVRLAWTPNTAQPRRDVRTRSVFGRRSADYRIARAQRGAIVGAFQVVGAGL